MIEVIVGIVVFLVAGFLATAQSHLEREDDPRAGSVSLLRNLVIVLLGAFYLVYSNLSLSLAILLVVVWFFQQLAGRLLGSRFGERSSQMLSGMLVSWDALVRPVRLFVPERVEEYEAELIESVEEFSETVVREVMVPRVDVEFIPKDVTLEQALSLFVSTGFSRLPVVGESLDDVVGVLYLKDVARVIHQDPGLLQSTNAQKAARKPFFTPESKPVSDLLQQMQQAKTQIAIVSDEYGGVAGIATVEDLIEELVGEIVDEYDREGEEIELIAKDVYRVNPRLTLDELSEHCELDIEDEDVDTVGGLVTKVIGELPKGGEVVQSHGIEFTAERVDAKRGRILSVLVRKLEDD